MANTKLIIMDMDGVCVNFVRGVGDLYDVKEFDRQYLDLSTRLGYETPPWDFYPLLDSNGAEVWQRVADGGHQFWRNLPETEEYIELMEMLREYEIVFVSHPTRAADSVKGKVLWLQDRFTNVFRNYFIGGYNKRVMAKSGGILIDDNEKNVEDFIAAGGKAILFPRPWNKNRDKTWKDHVENGLHSIANPTSHRLYSIEESTASGLPLSISEFAKPRPQLLPWTALWDLLEVFEVGAKKYAVDDWKHNRPENSYQFNKAMRHLVTWWNGEDVDPEDGQHHLLAVAFHALTGYWHFTNGSAVEEREL